LALRMADINGNSFIGVFCSLIGDRVLCPVDAPDEFVNDLERTLGVKAVRASIGATSLHGSLVRGNSRGIIIPYFYDEDEVRRTLADAGDMEDVHILSLDDPHTAWGNNILSSEKAALVNPDIRKGSLELIGDILGVEVVQGTIAGVKTVGSVAAMNSKGMVVHPRIDESERKILEELFGVDIAVCTANFGSPYLGASIIANDEGALVGRKTSGVEMNRIENTLDLI